MVVARKPGKLPEELIQEKYNLEYGNDSLSIQSEALEKFNSYAIVDDPLATGGTVDCVAKLIHKKRKKDYWVIESNWNNKIKWKIKI